MHRTRYRGQENKRTFSVDIFWKWGGKKKDVWKWWISSLPVWQPYQAKRVGETEEVTKFYTLWYQCVKGKIQLFLGTFVEMKSGLLKWCYQNQRPHHELQAKRKPFVLYIQTDKGVLPTAHICSVSRNQSSLKTTRSYLLVTKVAWLTQMPSWESKHDFSSKSQINYFKRKVKFKELRKRRNLLKSICPSTLEEIPARGTRMSRRRWEPCFSTLKKKK